MDEKKKVVKECIGYLEELNIKLNLDSFEQCVESYYDFININNNNNNNIVLDAKPGHGKTTALYCFVNYLINNTKESLLLVFKEIEQQYLMEEFLLNLNSKKVVKRKLLNVNQENQNMNSTSKYQQIITITHARLENLILNKQFGLKKSDLEIKKLLELDSIEKRKIIIDEEPNLFYYEEFKVDDNSWIDEQKIKKAYDYSKETSYQIKMPYKEGYTSNIILYQTFIRCMIQMLIIQEQLANTSCETKALINHQTKEDRESFNTFFEKIEKKIESGEIFEREFIKRFMCFKALYYHDNVGFFTPEQDSNPKTIIVANKIDFNILGSDILIMDGTASYFTEKYRQLGFVIKQVADSINYKRADIIIRNINSSASRRDTKKILYSKQILHDISEVKNDFKLRDVPLIPKKSDAEAFKIKIDRNQNYNDIEYVSKHIFNTRGSNELNSLTSIYITSLPIKPPNYYRAFASVLYSKRLDYRLRELINQENLENSGWFVDEKLQKIYMREILNELIQIIMRTDLRNLQSEEKIYIFIATILVDLIQNAFEITKFKVIQPKANSTTIKMQMKIKEKCKEIRKFFDNEIVETKLSIGRIGKGKSIQSFINNQYDNNKEYFDKKLNEYGLEMVIELHGTQKRKYIKKVRAIDE
ncbi:hypothetical protein [Vagococcus xieshaowenii]|uniref:Helicase/UvrB N-terminal domain-containing protein n=1 Tax=Vagococcus xieshaowenii TaxID=2562451 RepID=A0AAJ5JQB5_9ENTE|nr:hypothetical protein [Vagococcus xieshaowenii]QCA28744.1 hypothetical protein E4Z98_05220 [Vagococcus xieshaowenii]TFZ40448.1 hypothetical protein E4031_06555 [Vagococcus xieshaowenii]